MMNQEILYTVVLSIRIGLIATLINLPIAFLLSYLMSRKVFYGKSVVDGLINLPMVMPPVTVGYLLLIVLGKNGFIGSYLFELFGIRIAFTTTAAIIASMIVSFPLLARSIRVSIDMVDINLERAALTLGASKIKIFYTVILPQIKSGVISGTVLSFARCLGEFGATMTFAGNIENETRTIPLAVFAKLQIPGREKEAAFLVMISILISFIAMFLSSIVEKKGRS